MTSEISAPAIDPDRLGERKRQVARRMRIICPDIEEEELARIVERIARIELRHESEQLGFPCADLDAEPPRRPSGRGQ